jgi:hypothetical protein
VVNLSHRAVTATISFCDGKSCGSGGALFTCDNRILQHGEICGASIEAKTDFESAGVVARYVSIALHGVGALDARGSMKMETFEPISRQRATVVVEAR